MGQQIEGGQHRGRVGFRSQHQKVQAHRRTALTRSRRIRGYSRCLVRIAGEQPRTYPVLDRSHLAKEVREGDLTRW
ncbi:hypothetical protein C791_7655 [Amycolatopsis azurea DSM 43854]|uniref:Uncharacterized protein n=1 Tax=Amycolatopsis azurea DSM 43854 TaxID=1238180 RepID=M2PW72_9PSEU|nr:hypothetical protein C791_7655 [Amycolatopsis azurea DSM 43854]